MARARRVDPDTFVDDDDEITTVAEEAPRRRRRSADLDEREASTARTRRAAGPADDEDDDEPEADDFDETLVVRGRKRIKEDRPRSEGRADRYFRWGSDAQVVKFLDEEPWSYNQHWVDREGRRSFPCLRKNCPLCDIGNDVTQKIVYSVLNLSHESGPTVQVLEVGITVDGTLSGYDDDPKTGPLNRLFWGISRSNAAIRNRYNYSFVPIKERDLEDDWDIDLADVADALDDAEPLEPQEVLGKVTRAMLAEIADEAMA